jgi:hypothetical protein
MYLLKIQNSSSIRTHCGRTCKQPALTKSTMKLQTCWLHPKKPMTGFKFKLVLFNKDQAFAAFSLTISHEWTQWSNLSALGPLKDMWVMWPSVSTRDAEAMNIPKIEVCHWISRCLLRRILRQTRKGEQQLATTTESLTHSLKETATSAVHFHLWLISILYMKKHRIPLFVLLLCTILFFVLAST